MDLDDIWDQPVAPSPPRAAPSEHAPPARSSPGKRRRTTLFLSSDSEGENDASKDQSTYRTRTPKRVPKDIEALFDDLEDEPGVDDDLGELAPALDLDQLRKQADARHAKHSSQPRHQILPGSSPTRDFDGDEDAGGKKGKDDDEPEGKKKPKQRAKLDEERLLGKDGLPALVKQAKHFQPRGKGHEVSDLNRLLQTYQFWAHKMYPKTPFNDSVQRIEKLCHGKRMHNMLGVWRDEEKGLINGQKVDELDSPDEGDSDSEDSHAGDKEDDDTAPPERAQSSDAEGAPREPQSTASSPPPRPPSSASEFTSGAPDDDFDIDAMLREEQEAAASRPQASTSSAPPASNPPPPMDADDDQAMWDELHDFEEPPSAASKSGPSNTAQTPALVNNIDEDEDMWEIVREMEQEQAPQPATKPTTNGVEQSDVTAAPVDATGGREHSATEEHGGQKATNDDGWDEMYL